jgi:hypothetical protein
VTRWLTVVGIGDDGLDGLAPATRARVEGVALVVVATVVGPSAVVGQAIALSPEEQRWADAGWSQDLAFAAANALLAGVVTGVFRALSDDGSFGEGFRLGAAGGAITYAGKRVAAQRFGGAGLLGRQVASVGGSVTANARDGRGAFDRLILQLGLGRLYWDRIESDLSFRPDVITLYYTAAGLADDRIAFDWSRSLSSGTPVFLTREGASTLNDNAAGRAFGGVVLVDVNAELPVAHIAAHERVHVIQYDQHLALWGEAAERGVASLFGTRVAGVLGLADLGIGLVPFAPFRGALSRGHNPLEVEADFLTVR